jgi:hypothetical protein
MLEQHLSNLSQRIQKIFEALNLESNNHQYDQIIKNAWLNPAPVYSDCDLNVLSKLDENEQVIAVLALSQYIAPSILLPFETARIIYPNIRLIGGVLDSKLFMPTVQTALLLLEPNDPDKHYDLIRKYFRPESPLFELGVLRGLEKDPLFGDCRIECTFDFISKTVTGQEYDYPYSVDFPAKRLKSELQWKDLIVPFSVEAKLNLLKTSFRYHKQVIDRPVIGNHFKKNIVALFSGEPGTGKSMTAALLGKELNLPVYRIDTTDVVSKWVGETSKNLRNLFDVAENKNWILFFDEADTIFSKRSKGDASTDQYRNQDTAYLLQRIDSFKGNVILATNLGINIDDAFRRRIDMDITFMHPDKETRIRLWKKAFQDAGLTFTERGPQKLMRGDLPAGGWDTPDLGMNFEEIAEYWEKATGAKVMKVMKRLIMEAIEKNNNHLPSGVIVTVLNNELGLRKM